MRFTQTPNQLLRASFYENVHFSDNAVVITPLLDSAFGKEIRLAFKEGQSMKEHQTKFPISVMTLRGSITFSVGENQYILNAGDVISLEGGVKHALHATKESIVRLSLHKSDSAKRVAEVLSL